jgi:hypothetical protein
MNKSVLSFLTFFFSLTLILSACQTKPTYQQIMPATLKPGDSVPLPSGSVILTIRGKVGITHIEDRLDFDLDTLERIGLVELQVDDPEYNRIVTLRGPLLKDVLAVAQMQPDAKHLFASALNQYTSTIPLEVLQWPVIIATWRDGARLPLEEKGPIQIAFPNKSYTIDPLKYNPMWVWHLRTLTIE